MYLNVEILKGKTLVSILRQGNEELIFTTQDGETYRMYHEQDCCESVTIEDVCGSLDDLVGTPLLMSVESTEQKNTDYGTLTWTFYRFATVNGSVTIRWCGESNGYYSESVEFVKVVQ